MDEEDILGIINKIKEERRYVLNQLHVLNKTIFEYEMRLFLLSKKRESQSSQTSSKILTNIEKKINRRLNKFKKP
jgi:hypothetical protein